MPLADSQKHRTVRGSTPGTEIHAFARTMFHELMNAGYQARDVITFATELLDLVISSLRNARPDPAAVQGPRRDPDDRK